MTKLYLMPFYKTSEQKELKKTKGNNRTGR